MKNKDAQIPINKIKKNQKYQRQNKVLIWTVEEVDIMSRQIKLNPSNKTAAFWVQANNSIFKYKNLLN